MNTTHELRLMCQHIADDLKRLYDNSFTQDELEYLQECGEAYDIYSYFEDALDWEYIISSHKSFLGVRVWVTLGGPNIWVDTRNGEVKGAWGSDIASAWLPREICDVIDVIFEEIYAN